MPLEGLEEEGLPKNPDIHLAQLKFLLTVEEGVDREAVWGKLIAAIKENSEKCLPHFSPTFRPSPLFDLCAKTKERMNYPHTYPIAHLHTHTCNHTLHTHTCNHTLKAMVPFYKWVCSEVGRPLDSSLLAEMEEMNRKELEQLEEKIEDSEKNFGETEQRDALMAKAEYLCRVGDKVRVVEGVHGLS